MISQLSMMCYPTTMYSYPIVDGAPLATLTELRFPSPGLRAKHATLGSYTHQPGNSVGVAFSRRRYSQLEFYHNK